MNQIERCNPELTAVSIFAYNRPAHLEQILKFFENGNLPAKYCFHIFVDGAENFSPSNDYVKYLAINFSKICEYSNLEIRTSNFGLSRSIVFGLNRVFQLHNRSVILEDDIVPTVEFMRICDIGLINFQHHNEISTITGWNYANNLGNFNSDFILAKRHSSWGWATWSNRWFSIDWNLKYRNLSLKQKIKVFFASPDLLSFMKLNEKGEIDSWATLLNINFILQGTRSLVPRVRLVENIGQDGSGTHSVSESKESKTHAERTQNIPTLKIGTTASKSSYYDAIICLKHSILNNSFRTILYLFLSRFNLINRKR